MSDGTIPVVPALRWDDETGYGLGSPAVARQLDAGVLGFILFGGPAEAARVATAELRRRAGRPLLFGADLERGAGQQFDGATPLPPLAALASLEDEGILEAAGALTAREAVALGVSWIFAPVADLALEPRNPIVGTRSPGADPHRVGAAVAAWIRGCRAGGGLPCVKHFPGHGRTTEDSHRALPVVSTDAATLRDTDLVPFRAALAAGVPSVMTAHVAFPALDSEGRAATRSRPIVHDLLRREMGFGGVVVTDALIMEGAGSPAVAMAEALAAGVDVLLYPPEGLDPRAALDLAAGTLEPAEATASGTRIRRLVAAGPEGPSDAPVGTPEDRARAAGWADRTLRVTGGGPVSGDVALTVVDDDRGGPYPAPSRAPFDEALRAAGLRVHDAPEEAEGRGSPVLCLYAEPRGWKGRAGLSVEARAALGRWAERHGASGRILIFGGPVLLEEMPPGIPTILAWGGEPLMQEAAARCLARGAAP